MEADRTRILMSNLNFAEEQLVEQISQLSESKKSDEDQFGNDTDFQTTIHCFWYVSKFSQKRTSSRSSYKHQSNSDKCLRATCVWNVCELRWAHWHRRRPDWLVLPDLCLFTSRRSLNSSLFGLFHLSRHQTSKNIICFHLILKMPLADPPTILLVLANSTIQIKLEEPKKSFYLLKKHIQPDWRNIQRTAF